MFSAADHTKLITERYGADNNPGVSGGNDHFTHVKENQIPDSFNTSTISSYRLPPDLFGASAVALIDPPAATTGNDSNYSPHQYHSASKLSNIRTDDPYELNLDAPLSDTPYTYSDLEGMLRYNDPDAASLSRRIPLLAPSIFANSERANANRARNLYTHDSRSLPVPTVQLPPHLRNTPHITTKYSAGEYSLTIYDLYLAKLSEQISDETTRISKMKHLMPVEFRKGTLFNINRLFGNGQDDNNNGVTDEGNHLKDTNVFPILVGAEDDYNYSRLAWPGNSLWGASQFDSKNNELNVDQRLNVARGLYCLMLLLIDEDFEPPFTEALSATEKKEELRRRIAQWAINTVDMRDSDAIMTPFEYDPNPFDGWDVDGNPQTVETNRELVFGMEYPDLILTEAIAFHDKRLKDTKHDSGDQNTRIDDADPTKIGDNDLDQYRVPQGSLFIELLCMQRPDNTMPLPRELYNSNGLLDVGRLAPPNAQQDYHPVWRIITHKRDDLLAEGTPEAQYNTAPDTTRMEFDATKAVDREFWLTPMDIPDGHLYRDRVFSNRKSFTFPTNPGNNNPVETNALLAPGQYLLAGPRENTVISSKDDGSGKNIDSLQAITIDKDTGAVTIKDTAGTAVTPNAVGMVIGAKFPTLALSTDPVMSKWSNLPLPTGIGMSLSEPLPNGGNYYPPPNPDQDARVPSDAYDDPDAPMNTYPDEPLDADNNRPLGKESLLFTGTEVNYQVLYLQRLANPLLPWNPVPGTPGNSSLFPVNPYITVDLIDVDLTIFNGEDKREPAGWDKNSPTGIGSFDPDDDPDNDPNHPLKFASRQGGADLAGAQNIWHPFSDEPADTVAQGLADHFFDHHLVHTLGSLNKQYTDNVGTLETTGFPWLYWANSPYSNPMELLLVPTCSAARFGVEFIPTASVDNPYTDTQANFAAPYGHLLNFFHSSNTADSAANLVRIFDAIGMPSPYAGAETWFNPAHFQGDLNGFAPPFNSFSKFRDPGKVNINTIFDPEIWNAIVRPPLSNTLTYDKMNASRIGFDPTTATTPSIGLFTNPFRAAGASKLVADASLEKTPVEASLLRPDMTDSTKPLFHVASTNAYNNTTKNPYFRYQALQHLGNKITTQSNVYAVWITVGYFEVLPHDVDAGHPDGYEYGPELGWDTGDAIRHRGFYVVDRSIPVGYQPGKNHNVDDVITLRKFIE